VTGAADGCAGLTDHHDLHGFRLHVRPRRRRHRSHPQGPAATLFRDASLRGAPPELVHDLGLAQRHRWSRVTMSSGRGATVSRSMRGPRQTRLTRRDSRPADRRETCVESPPPSQATMRSSRDRRPVLPGEGPVSAVIRDARALAWRKSHPFVSIATFV
jgi:hypothetical protein